MRVLVWRSKDNEIITRSPYPCKWGLRQAPFGIEVLGPIYVDERLFVYRLLSHLSFLPIIFDGYAFFG